MATGPTPNQIQLEVQVNQQIDNNVESEPEEAPPAEFPEDEEEEETPSPEPEESKRSCLAYISLLFILLLMLWPFILTLINYYTDFNLWQFIKSTHSDYNAAYSHIVYSKNSNISILTCSFNGENSLSPFESFLINTTSITGCQCNYISSTNLDCSTLSNQVWTTSNIDDEECNQYKNDTASQCLECRDCTATSIYDTSYSPYYLYSVDVYDNIDDKKEKEKYCSPHKMNENIRRDSMDTHFTHCGNACIAFFGISGIWILCGLCAGCKVRWREIYRSYLWCFKGEKPKKRSKYHRDDKINRDEFTIFVVSILLLHVFEDVVQCIIGIMFSIYKQSNGGSDCIEGWKNISYSNSVDLVRYTGGLSIVEIMTHDGAVELFFVFSFLSVFFSGIYGIRLFSFDLQKVLIYPWWKNLLFVIIAILLGLFFILLVLSPFWGAVWLSSDYLYLTDGESAFLMWTFIVGCGGYIIAICMPLCFADQLDCACDCGDGCC